MAPPKLPGFTATVDPSESLLTSGADVSSRVASGHEPGLQGLSGSDTILDRPPFVVTPGSRLGAHVDTFPTRAGFATSQRLAAPQVVTNEASSIRCSLRLPTSLPGASHPPLLGRTPGSLHVLSTLYMVSSLHLTG